MLAEGLESVKNLAGRSKGRIQSRNTPYLSSKFVDGYFDQCPQKFFSPWQSSPLAHQSVTVEEYY